MKRRLSSLQTVLMKIVVPAIWIPVFGYVVVMMFLDGIESGDFLPRWAFLFVWLMPFGIICWNSVRLKDVSVDETLLYVSNYFKEVSIPLSEIYDVTENVWVNNHPVTIHLKSPSEFGDKIVFMPTHRMFAFFSSHPVVNELKELARSQSMTARINR